MSVNICIYGAGSIGCYVGGRLAAAGAQVAFVGRERLAQEVAAHGLRLTDYQGSDVRVAPADTRFHTDVNAAAMVDLVLVTVKSAATADAARELAAVLKPGALVISFQNGIGNDAVLREVLRDQIVLAGMVQFNVIQRGQGAFHQGTQGGLDVPRDAALRPFLAAFERAGLPLHQHEDMRAVQWSKLLLNLNNAVNALSNLPLKQELSQRSYRRCVAAAQRELLGLLDAAGIQPVKLTPLPTRWLPRVLALPDRLFAAIFGKMLAIDPLARSSMLDDLDAGRVTEVDWLNGEVVRLAQSLGRQAPVNAKLQALVHAAEQGGRRTWAGDELLAQLS